MEHTVDIVDQTGSAGKVVGHHGLPGAGTQGGDGGIGVGVAKSSRELLWEGGREVSSGYDLKVRRMCSNM